MVWFGQAAEVEENSVALRNTIKLVTFLADKWNDLRRKRNSLASNYKKVRN